LHVVPSRVYKWSKNLFTNPNTCIVSPSLSHENKLLNFVIPVLIHVLALRTCDVNRANNFIAILEYTYNIDARVYILNVQFGLSVL
jgi:hypothetical protein